jgi:predicted RNA binding protein YcfA (HicA-like mRNA interferase family)
MKYEELHKRVRKAGWELVMTSGSHRIYKKEERIRYPFTGERKLVKGLL